MLNTISRLIAIILLLTRRVYWYISGKKAQKEKPGTEFASLRSITGWIVSDALEVFILLQLVKIFTILPIHNNLRFIQLAGIVVIAVGVWICFIARRQLGINWSHAADYQIKKGHKLITSGVYHYIRHPIYLGLALSWIGAEMAAGSYLCISFLGIFVAFYVQGRREEKNFLRSEFSKDYHEYMKYTKMLIPFIL